MKTNFKHTSHFSTSSKCFSHTFECMSMSFSCVGLEFNKVCFTYKRKRNISIIYPNRTAGGHSRARRSGRGPAVIIIGEVAAVRLGGPGLSLSGLRVGLTGTPVMQEKLRALFEAEHKE